MKKVQIHKQGKRVGLSRIPTSAGPEIAKLWYVRSVQPFQIEIEDAATQRDIDTLRKILSLHGVERGTVKVVEGVAAQETAIGKLISAKETFVQINFGADTAEEDHNLAAYFVPTEAFRSVQNKDQTLVVGAKGSGKSAILAKLKRDVDSNYTVVITPERFHKALLQEIVEKEKAIGADIHAFSAAWMHTILMEVYKQVLTNRRGLRVGALAKIHDYVRDNAADAEMDLLSRFIAFCRRIEGIKIGPFDATIKTRQLESAFKLEPLLSVLPALKTATEGKVFMVLIDELDYGWDNTALANTFLISLLATALKLHGFHTGIRVTAFLRTEIFDILKGQFDQLDKMREKIQTLRWNRNSLAGLISRRIAFALNFPERYLDEPEIVVSALFPVSPDHSDQDGFDYILNRTGLRPREVIQFSRLAYRAARDNDEYRISSRALLDAEDEFSRWRFEHLASEHLFTFPGLETLLEHFRHQNRVMSYERATEHMTAFLVTRIDDSNCSTWLKGSDEHSLVRTLFSIGFLGFRDYTQDSAMSNRPSGREFVYHYERPAARIRTGVDLSIQPGFWRYLEIQQ